MSNNNPQHKYLVSSKWLSRIQDICEFILLCLAIWQRLTSSMDGKIFLVTSASILFASYIASLFKTSNFDEGHYLRQAGLIDNSFNERKLPNYNSDQYYSNGLISIEEIKLLANIHENSLFTSRIAEKMVIRYYPFVAIPTVFFILNLFFSGIDDYTSILLSFLVSSSFVAKCIKIKMLEKASKNVFDKANDICNIYEKHPVNVNTLLPKVIDLLLLYENALFETKIILDEGVFNNLNPFLSKEWARIKNSYSIYKTETEDN